MYAAKWDRIAKIVESSNRGSYAIPIDRDSVNDLNDGYMGKSTGEIAQYWQGLNHRERECFVSILQRIVNAENLTAFFENVYFAPRIAEYAAEISDLEFSVHTWKTQAEQNNARWNDAIGEKMAEADRADRAESALSQIAAGLQYAQSITPRSY